MPYLFSYGSNNPDRLRERLGHDFDLQGAALSGHHRVFRGMSRTWGGGVASVAPKKGSTVYGYIAQVSSADMDLMDRYEGVAGGVYRRKGISVVTRGGVRTAAVVYVATSTAFGEPTDAYLDAVAKTIGAFWKNADGSKVTRDDITVR